MNDAKYLAVGRIFLEETKAALPVPQTEREARRWQTAIMLKCAERARREQDTDFGEWQEAKPSPEASAAYERMADDILEGGLPTTETKVEAAEAAWEEKARVAVLAEWQTKKAWVALDKARAALAETKVEAAEAAWEEKARVAVLAEWQAEKAWAAAQKARAAARVAAGAADASTSLAEEEEAEERAFAVRSAMEAEIGNQCLK